MLWGGSETEGACSGGPAAAPGGPVTLLPGDSPLVALPAPGSSPHGWLYCVGLLEAQGDAGFEMLLKGLSLPLEWAGNVGQQGSQSLSAHSHRA